MKLVKKKNIRMEKNKPINNDDNVILIKSFFASFLLFLLISEVIGCKITLPKALAKNPGISKSGKAYPEIIPYSFVI